MRVKLRNPDRIVDLSGPGTRHKLYFGFLSRAAGLFTPESGEGDLVPCAACGAPTVARSGMEATECTSCKTKRLAHTELASRGERAATGARRRR